ncbi:MAG: PTS sugar transporter subunit IIA [Thermodesulfobacteriota bacterium]
MMSIQEVARELRVSEKTVRRMLWRGELKGIRVGGQWRFPVENLAALLPSGARAAAAPLQLRAAPIRELVETGGIHYRIGGESPHEVLREIVNQTPCVPASVRPALFEAVWERESLCSTGIGNGIAVPHPIVPLRSPRVEIPSCVGLFFLERPVDFGYVDGEKVSILFLLLLNSLQEHLRTLSRLVRLLREESLSALLHSVPLRAEIHSELARLEKSVIPETTG